MVKDTIVGHQELDIYELYKSAFGIVIYICDRILYGQLTIVVDGFSFWYCVHGYRVLMVFFTSFFNGNTPIGVTHLNVCTLYVSHLGLCGWSLSHCAWRETSSAWLPPCSATLVQHRRDLGGSLLILLSGWFLVSLLISDILYRFLVGLSANSSFRRS